MSVNLNNWKIGRRLMVLVALFAVMYLGIGGVSLVGLRDALYEQKGDETRRIVEVAHSFVKEFHARAGRGELTEAQAKEGALAALKGLRYDGEQYYWVNDMDALMLMHPTAPKLVGTSLRTLKDAHGNFIFADMIEVVKKDGAGQYTYYWPPDSTSPKPKVSYVAGFKPWGWIIGSGVFVEDVEKTFWGKAELTGGMAVLTVLIVVVVATSIARSVSRPVKEMTNAMDALARGDRAIDIPARNRKDEIGEMAAAVQVFKDGMIEADRLAEEQRREQEARTARAKRIEDLCQAFDATSTQAVKSVAAAASQMQSSSEAMGATAEEANRQASAVAAASEQASANVQTVASAAEELSSSISEISRQVTQASQIASAAVSEAEKTNVKVQGLAQAANKIGEVVALITDIAEQTNLLALNATIEAARAGDAGKGFAVVASEVKNLANQTAKATDEIGAQIAGIQSATQEAVAAIESITKTISKINEVNSGVASAVEAQGAATQEIARNVEQAAAGTQEVSSNIGGVSQAANETGTAAEQINKAAGELSQQSETLRAEVDKFLAGVRSA
ncbi:methyl-accepting chemotaxis protein [Shumkonia mesophila]|uniref:methyl-accepting chemotaxis protein n=1 Tax=Shumkonia mesophila TaxID=2838854 RepID=UPI0029341D80|nr:cache domain-containing protein [Shumkonia mesophila]